jgi:hypothetical protein
MIIIMMMMMIIIIIIIIIIRISPFLWSELFHCFSRTLANVAYFL